MDIKIAFVESSLIHNILIARCKNTEKIFLSAQSWRWCFMSLIWNSEKQSIHLIIV